MKLLIKNGTVINPKTHLHEKTNILVEDDLITKIGANIQESQFDDALQLIDATGKIVTPGFIDLHVHLREPGFEQKETIKTGSMACAKGGYTTVACMPNTRPALDCPETISHLQTIIQMDAVVNVLPIGAITKNIQGLELTDHQALIDKGAIAISDDGRTTMNTDFMLQAFKFSKIANVPVITHSEDHDITEKFKSEVYPIEAEYTIVQRDINLCKQVDGILHVAHVSGNEALKAIKDAKNQSFRVTCEVAPHHFALNDTMFDPLDPYSKVNPPIRNEAERRAVINAIKSGIIDIIATDHAPHEEETKKTSYEKASYGISGIETAFSIAYTTLVEEENISLDHIVGMMTFKAAEIGRLKNIGSIEVGYQADITIVDLEKSYIINPDEFISKGKNSPFRGMKVKGCVETTIHNGLVVYQNK